MVHHVATDTVICADKGKVSMHVSKYSAHKLVLCLTAFADHLNLICGEDQRRDITSEFAIPYKWH